MYVCQLDSCSQCSARCLTDTDRETDTRNNYVTIAAHARIIMRVRGNLPRAPDTPPSTLTLAVHARRG